MYLALRLQLQILHVIIKSLHIEDSVARTNDDIKAVTIVTQYLYISSSSKKKKNPWKSNKTCLRNRMPLTGTSSDRGDKVNNTKW